MFTLRQPGESDPLRLRVRRWLARNPAPTGAQLLDAGFLVHFFARALTLGGGTAEIQRNVLAERLLGLPRADAAGWTSTGGPGPGRKKVADE